MIGTTDVPVEAFENPRIADDEVHYLLDLANAYLERPLGRDDIVWTYSGVRPLYDDGASDPSAVTRDYVLKVDAADGAPVLSSFGGKITTYRKLAEHALRDLAPFFPGMKAPWTARATLPGGDLPKGDRAAWESELRRKYAQIDGAVVHGVARRHGSRAHDGPRRCTAHGGSRPRLRSGAHAARGRLSRARGVGHDVQTTCCGAGRSAACR